MANISEVLLSINEVLSGYDSEVTGANSRTTTLQINGKERIEIREEIKEKLDQGCKQIFLSRLFSTNYKFKKGFLGRARFNLLSQNFSTKFIALGGIKKENFSKLKGLNIVGFAMSSDKKKAGTYVPAFFKK